MDNYGWENTNSSRFYVTFRETPWMNNFHVAFGELTEGFDVLDSIEKLGILEGWIRNDSGKNGRDFREWSPKGKDNCQNCHCGLRNPLRLENVQWSFNI